MHVYFMRCRSSMHEYEIVHLHPQGECCHKDSHCISSMWMQPADLSFDRGGLPAFAGRTAEHTKLSPVPLE